MHNPTPTIKDSVLEKIQKEQINPKAKWQFTLRHATLWIPGIAVTAIGGIAFAGILFGGAHAGWEYREFTSRSPVLFFLQAIPIIWVISFALFAGSIVRVLRLTTNGYRYKAKAILLLSATCSVVLGSILFLSDSDDHQNRLIRFPVERTQVELWSHPESGRIAGLIQLQDDGSVLLLDMTGHTWLLNTQALTNTSFLQDERTVRVLGTQTDEANFLACAMFPWELSPMKKEDNTSPFPDIRSFMAGQVADCITILDTLRYGMSNERKTILVP